MSQPQEKQIKIKLSSSIENEDKVKITELVFSDNLTAENFVGLNDPLGWEDQIILISHMTGLHIPFVKKLKAKDFVLAVGVLKYFLGLGPKIGSAV